MRQGGMIVPYCSKPRMCMHRKGRWLCRGISRIRKLAEAEFDAFGTRVEGLALELARGLVAAKEETAESTRVALAERDAQIAERDARIAELINSMNGDISRRESTTDEMAQALVEAKTTLASKSYDFDEARLRSRNAAIALEASHAAFAALEAETDRLRASRHHHSK